MAKRRVIPAIIVQGGAGNRRNKAELPRYKKELADALSEGMDTLRRGSAVDAVEAAVRYMENSTVFNAGNGSVLTLDGRIQLDAAIMAGDSLRAGAVGACSCTHNPIRLARFVMEQTRHPSADVRAKYEKMKMEKVLLERRGTVGAVAIDGEGSPASAVSTGGTWMKQPGRVGDSAVIGAGIYADFRSGAASATGIGEEIMRNALSWGACRLMRRMGATTAARLSVDALTRTSGRDSAGVITVDTRGRLGVAYNTDTMGRAWFHVAKGKIVVEV